MFAKKKVDSENLEMKWPFRFILWVLPINITLDFLAIFNDSIGITVFLRSVLLIGFFFLVLYKIEFSRVLFSVLIFTFYCFFQLIFTDNFTYSLSVTIKTLIPLWYLAVGYFMFRRRSDFISLVQRSEWVPILILLGFSLFNLFQVGGSSYADDLGIDFGNQNDNWNSLTYTLLISPVFFFVLRSRTRSIILVTALIMVSLLLLISFKRIAILGFLFGTFIFLTYARASRRYLKYFLFIVLVLASLYPLYNSALLKVYDARQDRFEEGALEEEGRYLETLDVWSSVMSFNDPIKSLIGGRAFDSIGNYLNGRFGRRQLHVDYNLIVNTIGLVGLLLYLNIYLQMFMVFFKFKGGGGRYYMVLEATFISLLLTTLLTSIGGQMYAVTFRLIAFLFMGAILAQLSTKSVSGIKKGINENPQSI